MQPARLLAAALGALFFLRGTAATADEPVVATNESKDGRLPLSYVERPLTLPRLVLDPGVDFNVTNVNGTFANLALRAAFGVTDDFEIEAIVAPLQLSPTVTYGQVEQPGPSLGLTYRVPPNSGSEVAVHIDATVFTLPGLSGVILRPGLPLLFHMGKRARIDCGAYVPITAAYTTTVGLRLPFAVAVDIVETMHIGASTGFTIETFNAPANFVLPLGVFAGYAIGGKDGPVVDIDPFFRWPRLLPANPNLGENTADEYQVGVELRGYFYL